MKYAKALAAVLVTILSALAAVLVDGVSPTEWVTVAIAGVGAAGVFAAPNVPGAAYTKSILAALTAGLTILATAIVGGVDTTEWLQIIIGVAGAVGIYAVPNRIGLQVRVPTPR